MNILIHVPVHASAHINKTVCIYLCIGPYAYTYTHFLNKYVYAYDIFVSLPNDIRNCHSSYVTAYLLTNWRHKGRCKYAHMHTNIHAHNHKHTSVHVYFSAYTHNSCIHGQPMHTNRAACAGFYVSLHNQFSDCPMKLL